VSLLLVVFNFVPINALLFQIQRVLLCSFFFFLRLNLRLVEIIIATRD